MNLERQTNAILVNSIVNHPSIYESVRGPIDGPLDMSACIDNPLNVALFCERGGLIFAHVMPGLYEAHTNVLPEARGAGSIAIVREALHYMFTCTDAVEIITRCPEGNRAALALAKRIGGIFEFCAVQGWYRGRELIPADIYAMRIQDWMRDAPELPEMGEWFHRRLEHEFQRIGRKDDVHPDDHIHDRYVGAAVAMIVGGQPDKAITFYNRFAAAANYAPISIVAREPLVIDIRNALVRIEGEDFRIMQ